MYCLGREDNLKNLLEIGMEEHIREYLSAENSTKKIPDYVMQILKLGKMTTKVLESIPETFDKNYSPEITAILRKAFMVNPQVPVLARKLEAFFRQNSFDKLAEAVSSALQEIDKLVSNPAIIPLSELARTPADSSI